MHDVAVQRGLLLQTCANTSLWHSGCAALRASFLPILLLAVLNRLGLSDRL